jgi:hypothetical protein
VIALRDHGTVTLGVKTVGVVITPGANSLTTYRYGHPLSK